MIGRPRKPELLASRSPHDADRSLGAKIRIPLPSADDIREFLATKGVTDEELSRNLVNRVSQLPGQFETSSAVLSAMQSNELYGRPDNYYELLAGKYRALDKNALDEALRRAIDPSGFVWVVVGDAAKVKPQLAKVGLPIEEIQAR